MYLQDFHLCISRFGAESVHQFHNEQLSIALPRIADASTASSNEKETIRALIWGTWYWYTHTNPSLIAGDVHKIEDTNGRCRKKRRVPPFIARFFRPALLSYILMCRAAESNYFLCARIVLLRFVPSFVVTVVGHWWTCQLSMWKWQTLANKS